MRFFSRGKLLISGEYLVLKGATALAAPLKKGQDLKITRTGNHDVLAWESREYGIPWFRASFMKPFFEIGESSDLPTAQNLVKHFQAMADMNPRIPELLFGSQVTTDLGFNRQWGFGSSSSLVSNLAGLADVDPFTLHRKLSVGSGYDVVCAREEGPVFFKLKRQRYELSAVDLQKGVTKFLYFVYLGKKQDSRRHVSEFLSRKKAFRVEKRLVSELGQHMAYAANIEDFAFYMKEHEQVISSVLRMPGLKEGLFSDLEGEAKSLGAWGGDFAMITWKGTRKRLQAYLADKKLDTFFSFSELVKTR